MDYSDACVALVKESEGLVLHPYQDSGGVWTVGWGHELKLGESRDTIDEDKAQAYLTDDLRDACHAVQDMVRVPLTQGQLDALTDFCFNFGSHKLKDSTLMALLNTGDTAGASAQFPHWVYDDGARLPGLVTRRDKERAMFDGDTNEPKGG